MDSNDAISVKNVSKTFKIPHEKVSSLRGAFVNAIKRTGYEEFKALDDVSFEIKKGEFFGIIGRNGSGKSTLLKILAGIYNPDKGKVKINGLISPFLELGIGFNPELSGRDNIYLNATVLGLTKKEIDEKFDSIVRFSELERFIDQKLKNYSSGMQVRLAFSVSIHANREILLMDEVLAVGDSNFQSKCLTEFNRYKEIGKTVVLVTHDIATVQRYCDRAMLIRNGKIIKIGKAQDVVKDYMLQNMTDEQERINKNESSKEPEEWSDKKAIISRVEFLDNKENTKSVFKSNENMVARIHYKTKEKIKHPVFGVAIYSQDGIHISGPNTKTSKFPIEFIDGVGHIDFVIKNNPFFSGNYLFTVALFGSNETIPLDFRDKEYVFKVMSSDENQNGIINLDILWKK